MDWEALVSEITGDHPEIRLSSMFGMPCLKRDTGCAWHDDARTGKVFGMPCVKRAGKVVFGFSRTGMVFKLTAPDVHARALALPGAHLFDPSGRGEAFRQWVVVPPAQAGEWEALAYEALGQDHGVPPEAL